MIYSTHYNIEQIIIHGIYYIIILYYMQYNTL